MSEQPPGGPGGPQEPRQPGQPGDPEDLGSVAEEAAKLFGALSDWARDQSGDWATGVSGLAGHAAATARQVQDHVGENLANGSPECTWCPVCRTIHVVRQLSPEVRAHLTTAASSLLQAAAGVMATQVPPERRPGVERIDLDGADDPDAWDEETDQPADQPGSQPGTDHPSTDPENPL